MNTAAAAPASIIDLDVGGLEPPEPMVMVLDALTELQPGTGLRVLIDRAPVPLYRILERNGYAYRVSALEAARFEVLIWEGAPGA